MQRFFKKRNNEWYIIRWNFSWSLLYNIIGEFVFINPEGKKTTINDQFYEFEIANNFKKYIILEEFSIILSIIIVVIFFKNNATIIEQSPETKEEKDDTINLSLEEVGSDIK